MLLQKPYILELKFCRFKNPKAKVVYTCFKNEVCCSEGCCLETTYNLFTNWYFWIVMIIGVFLSTGWCKLWKCRKNGTHQNRSGCRNSISRPRSSSPPNVLSRTFEERHLERYFGSANRNDLNELVRLARLLEDQENFMAEIHSSGDNPRRTRQESNALDPPPYNRLETQSADPPPNYNAVCKNLKSIEGNKKNNQKEASSNNQRNSLENTETNINLRESNIRRSNGDR